MVNNKIRNDFVVAVHLKGMVHESINYLADDGNPVYVQGKSAMFYLHYVKEVEMHGLDLKEVGKLEHQDHFKAVVIYPGIEKQNPIKNDEINEVG